MIRVLLADDHRLMRDGLKNLIETVVPDIRICALASDGMEAIRLVEQEKPDVVLMDLQMPEMDGIEATGVLRKSYPNLPILMLTTYDDDDLILAAVRAGVSGYLLKDMSARELADAIYNAYAGKKWFDPEIAARLITTMSEQHGGNLTEELDPVLPVPKQEEQAKQVPLGPVVNSNRRALSGRELQILKLIVGGKNNREIAEAFNISEGTVKNYVSRIYEKLGVQDRAQAATQALRDGLCK